MWIILKARKLAKPIVLRNASMNRKPTWKLTRNNRYENIFAEFQSYVGPRGG